MQYSQYQITLFGDTGKYVYKQLDRSCRDSATMTADQTRNKTDCYYSY